MKYCYPFVGLYPMYGYFKVFHTFHAISSYHQNDIDYISKRYNLYTDVQTANQKTLIRYKNIIRDYFGIFSPDEILHKKLKAEASQLISQLSNQKHFFTLW